jgi:hypothetical protein
MVRIEVLAWCLQANRRFKQPGQIERPSLAVTAQLGPVRKKMYETKKI